MVTFLDISGFSRQGMYLLSITLLWAVVTAVYIYIQNRKIKRDFSIPLNKLCNAAQKVAEGDFSVRLVKEHSKKDKAILMLLMKTLTEWLRSFPV